MVGEKLLLHKGQLGGSATKPTTVSWRSLELEVNKHKRMKKAGEAVEIRPLE